MSTGDTPVKSGPVSGATVKCDATNCQLVGKKLVSKYAFRCHGCSSFVLHYKCSPLANFARRDGTLDDKACELVKAFPVLSLCYDCSNICAPDGFLTAFRNVHVKLDNLLAGQEELREGLAVMKEETVAAVHDTSASAPAPDSNITWAQVVAGSKTAAKAAMKELAKEDAEAELRGRTAVLDNFPLPGDGQTDRENIQELLGKLEQGRAEVDHVRRIGAELPAQGNRPAKPRKLKVVFKEAGDQAVFVGKETRAKLREPEWERDLPRLFVTPSRTADQRHRLWLLRRRRNALNRNLPRDSQWILDSIRYRLWKKENGQVDWNVKDAPVESWCLEYDDQPAMRGRQPPDPNATLYSSPPFYHQ